MEILDAQQRQLLGMVGGRRSVAATSRWLPEIELGGISDARLPLRDRPRARRCRGDSSRLWANSRVIVAHQRILIAPGAMPRTRASLDGRVSRGPVWALLVSRENRGLLRLHSDRRWKRYTRVPRGYLRDEQCPLGPFRLRLTHGFCRARRQESWPWRPSLLGLSFDALILSRF